MGGGSSGGGVGVGGVGGGSRGGGRGSEKGKVKSEVGCWRRDTSTGERHSALPSVIADLGL